MVELVSLLSLLNQIKQWLEFARASDEKKDAQYEAGIEALYTALGETKIYIGSIRQKEKLGHQIVKNPETEAQLSRLWMKASLEIRHYNPDLAERCRLKWDYWADPDGWTDEQLNEAHIALDEVFEEAGRLI